jgi:dienelactone hydrolase
VEILRPAAGAVVPGESGFFLVRLAPDADPATLAVSVRGRGRRLRVVPAEASATQAWGHAPCPARGRHVLRVSVRDRADSLSDADEVVVRCGPARRLAIGAVVETLVEHDHAPSVLRLTPVRPLEGGATYAVVATRALRTRTGKRTKAGAPFRAAAGIGRGERVGSRGRAPVFVAEPLDARNPYPSERLVLADGTIQIPDGYTARGLDADPRLDGARRFLRRLDALSEEHQGFSPHTAVVLRFESEVRLASATPGSVFLAKIEKPAAPATNLAPLLAALERDLDISPREVTVASVFTVEDVVAPLAAIRAQIAARAAADPPRADLADPDPDDPHAFGVFRPGETQFAALFDGVPPASIGAVARGRFESPEYRARDARGRMRIPPRFLDGGAAPPLAANEFLLAVPAGERPAGGFPVVIAQHGFCGSTDIVLDVAAELAAAGLAVIGAPAPAHGPGENCIGFFDFADFNTFGDNWRQASAELFQLAQLVAAGIDLDGDGASEIAGSDLGYIGVSMGGVIGAVFTALEPLVSTVVLNVPGGRLAQFAGSLSGLARGFLESFATEAGIPSRTCDARPLGPVCTESADCGGAGVCAFNEDFAAMLAAALANFQTQLDWGDGSAFAHLLRLDPPDGRPKPVLVQEGIGDTVVANPLTEALARAIGLPANMPDRTAGGVAGLWRFPPPLGHGILALAEVRAQAVRFLASGGTELVAP